MSEEKTRHILTVTIGLLWLAFQSYILFYPEAPLVERPYHLGFALLLLLLTKPLSIDRLPISIVRCLDGLLLVGVVAGMIYYFLAGARLSDRMEGIDEVLTIDVASGILLVVILLECVRRTIGWTLLGIIMVFILFGFIGTLYPPWYDADWVPELFRYEGLSLESAVESFTMTPNGVLGITTSTSVHLVFYFVTFGAFYSAIGGGQLFIDVGLKLAGRQKGGAAKAAVISSSLMGSISGSAVANVATTGLFSIPLMRRTGYQPDRAAAVESIASTGGQLMPPIMGVAAFVLAELLQMDYTQVAIAGIVPALAFYASIFLIVDLNARRTGLGVLDDDRTSTLSILPRFYLLLPPILLVALLISGRSASLSAFIAMLSCIPICYLSRASWRNLGEWLATIGRAARQAAEVAIPIAAIGLIIEVSIQSNLALKFSTHLMALSGNTTLGAMLLIIVGCIIMGMGLPTVAAYIIGAILFVPALTDLGIQDIAAHFFVMYYCVLSMVTPPVALASYAAAGLANANSMPTSMHAFRLSLVAFFVPFIFVFEPALLAQGTLWKSTGISLALLVGICGWAAAMEGYWFGELNGLCRTVAGALALCVFLTPLLLHLINSQQDDVALTRYSWLWFATTASMGGALLYYAVRRKDTVGEIRNKSQ